jgi:uroporphyrinogen-III synthase
MSEETKYFCITEAVALYLQKFIVYRKRKVFTGERTITDLKSYLNKHKSNEKFLVPCPENGAKDIANFLTDGKFNFTEAPMYRTVASDLSDLKDITYDVLVFFNPQVIESLYSNFPDFKQNETRLAGWGQATVEAILKHDLTCNIQGPTPELTSMQMALEKYLLQSNKPRQDNA